MCRSSQRRTSTGAALISSAESVRPAIAHPDDTTQKMPCLRALRIDPDQPMRWQLLGQTAALASSIRVDRVAAYCVDPTAAWVMVIEQRWQRVTIRMYGLRHELACVTAIHDKVPKLVRSLRHPGSMGSRRCR